MMEAYEKKLVPTNRDVFVMYSFDYVGPRISYTNDSTAWAENAPSVTFAISVEIRVQRPGVVMRNNTLSSVVVSGKPTSGVCKVVHPMGYYSIHGDLAIKGSMQQTAAYDPYKTRIYVPAWNPKLEL